MVLDIEKILQTRRKANTFTKEEIQTFWERNEERKRKIFSNGLPENFLRLPGFPRNDIVGSDGPSQHPQHNVNNCPQQVRYASNPNFRQLTGTAPGCFLITVEQAKLEKNYGITRMNPYVRIRVGHFSYTTHAHESGSKNPYWNKTIRSLIPIGIQMIGVQIFDECAFSTDPLIAWTQITLPDEIYNGKTVEKWYPLSGELGEDREGKIYIILSYSAQLQSNTWVMDGYVPPPAPAVPVQVVRRTGHRMLGNGYVPVPVSVSPNPPPTVNNPQHQLPLSEIEDMFPNIDKDIIRSTYESKGGNTDDTINALIQMGKNQNPVA